MAPPFREANFEIMFGEGISKLGEILDLGSDLGIVTKRGAFYYVGEDKIGQGKDNAKTFLLENPKLADDLENQIREKLGLPFEKKEPEKDK